MTFNMQPVTEGYGNLPQSGGKVLGQIPRLEKTMETRMAAIGLDEFAKDQILRNQIKMAELGVQSQQGQGGMDWLDLAQTGVDAFGALGGFGGGGGGAGGGMSFADGMDLGLPSFGDYSGIPSGGFGAFG